MKAVDLLGVHVEARSGAPLVLLREHDEPHRLLPIFVGTPEAVAIGLGLSGDAPPRPATHDLLASLVDLLDAHVERVEVTQVRDGAFIAELSVTAATGDRRIDSRPSDAIALAVRVDAPVFVADEVLDEAGVVMAAAEDDDEEEISAEVDRFRAFLDEIDPSAFGGPGEPPGPQGPAG